MADVASFFGTWTLPFAASSIPYLLSDLADFPVLRRKIRVITKNKIMISLVEFVIVASIGAAITVFVIRPPDVAATFIAAIAWPGTLSQLLHGRVQSRGSKQNVD